MRKVLRWISLAASLSSEITVGIITAVVKPAMRADCGISAIWVGV